MLAFFAAGVIGAFVLTAAAAAQTLHLQADDIRGDTRHITASGNVKAHSDSGLLCAAQMRYDRQSGIVRAFGEVRAELDGGAITGESALFDLRQRRGEIDAFHADLGKSGGESGGENQLQAEGAKLFLHGATISAAEMTLSSCPANSRDWQIVLSGAQADTDAEVVSGRGARLEFGGVPVMWLPFGSWYYGDDKKSGFLTPRFGYRSDGADVAAPYYYYLRDNYDATITPRWTQKHGLLLSGAGRYLFARSGGGAVLEWLPFEEQQRGRQRFWHGWRGSGAGGEWQATLHAENVSDAAYYKDFSNTPEELAIRHLPRAAALSYRRGGWHLRAAAEDYKVLRADHKPPHDILPMAQINGGGEGIVGRWSAQTQYANFRANDKEAPEGGRLFALARLERDWFWRGIALTPMAGVHASGYRLRDEDAPGFAVPFFRLDARRRFLWKDAPMGAAEAKWRAAMVYAPQVRQHNAPLFDTELLQLNSARVFDWNRFVGGDRAADARFLAYGAELRRRGADGGEVFFVGAAQRYYFRAPRITLASEDTPPQRGLANLLLDLRARPARNWRLESAAEWQPSDGVIRRFYADLRADFGGGKLMRAGVLLEEDESITWGAAAP
ncbi:MAG: LPS-assembly protein LptD, partial [Gammaproteobacteria bacterium]